MADLCCFRQRPKIIQNLIMGDQKAIIKTILISQYPLPYSKIGSWTNMYKNYLESNHEIDYIICEAPKQRFSGLKYEIVKVTLLLKIRRRLANYYRLGFIDALQKVISQNKNDKFIIQVVDNFKITLRIDQLLREMGVRENCCIQVFHHGFAPFDQFIHTDKYLNIFEKIDEVILLTNDSYKAYKDYYLSFPSKVSVLHNGIDTQKFHLPSIETKEKLKKEFKLEDKKVFIWCAQDRPKKGLTLILNAWKKVHAIHKETVLLVVGAKREVTIDGVVFIGRIPNDELAKYYQMSDCYLFPTLCQEGFPLSLTEALNCGCYCIASKQGGVAEVLAYGKYGRLIENPNYEQEWVTAINNYLLGKEKPILITEQIYKFEDWKNGMNAIIREAKSNLY